MQESKQRRETGTILQKFQAVAFLCAYSKAVQQPPGNRPAGDTAQEACVGRSRTELSGLERRRRVPVPAAELTSLVQHVPQAAGQQESRWLSRFVPSVCPAGDGETGTATSAAVPFLAGDVATARRRRGGELRVLPGKDAGESPAGRWCSGGLPGRGGLRASRAPRLRPSDLPGRRRAASGCSATSGPGPLGKIHLKTR